MDLFGPIISNELTIYQYKTDKDRKNFQLKYDIYNDDTIQTLLKKIYLSLNDNYTPNENFIFPFIQKNRISASKINQIEENIVPNKILRDLIKSKFGRFDQIKQPLEIKKFIKENKEIIDREIKSGDKGGLWLNSVKSAFKKEMKQYNEDKLSDEKLFKNSESLSHYYNDIDLNILGDSKLDEEIINKDNSIKLIFPVNRLNTLLSDYEIESVCFITLNDYLNFLTKKINIDEKIIFKGILRKYYPNVKEYTINKKEFNKEKKCDEFQINISDSQN